MNRRLLPWVILLILAGCATVRPILCPLVERAKVIVEQVCQEPIQDVALCARARAALEIAEDICRDCRNDPEAELCGEALSRTRGLDLELERLEAELVR